MGFAGLAVILATTGTYGVMSYVAASRAREFAVRMALGADRGRVARVVLGQGLRLTAVGLAGGVAAALAAAPLLAGLPVSVRPPDIRTVVPVAAAARRRRPRRLPDAGAARLTGRIR